ncbi:MAG: hypothetical protein AAGH40_11045 [Verrucomicrobiota bacterium]
MATPKNINIKDLSLDLSNFRTVQQADEVHAANALIAIHPEWFWALMESLIEDGYSPTENIIVLKGSNGELVVKEGNRRISSLKLIHGIIKGVELPDHISEAIKNLSDEWKKTNEIVPCAVYPQKDAAFVDKLVSRTHGKGETSGRDKWTSVARARYARDQNGKSEPGLDALELYLEHGKNLTAAQAERWAGDYPLTVLDEALKKLAPLLGSSTAIELVSLFPKKHKRILDKVMLHIGTSQLGFKQLRSKVAFWGADYGLQDPDLPEDSADSNGSKQSNTSGTTNASGEGSSASTSNQNSGQPRGKGVALPANDPKSVRKRLKAFKVRGKGREKVATLVDELRRIKLEDFPHAFCFLLRSAFEISAKAYCADHKARGGPSHKKKGGQDKALVDVLRDITNHMTKNMQDKSKVKELHGAMTELAKANGLLSVTSLNQLVHHPSFSVTPSDISITFTNLFPLLEEMNS